MCLLKRNITTARRKGSTASIKVHQNSMVWRAASGSGVVLQDFKPIGEHQIALQFGDEVRILAEYNNQWYRGTVVGSKSTGIFPCNHVALNVQGEDDTVQELVEVLKEWGGLLKSSFQERRIQEFTRLRSMVDALLSVLRRINASGVTETQKQELKQQAFNKIEQGRRLLGLDMVVRTPSGEAATETNMPLIQLYHLHRDTLTSRSHAPSTVDKSSAASGGPSGSPSPSSGAIPGKTLSSPHIRGRSSMSAPSSRDLYAGDAPKPPSRHLILNMKSFICSVNDETELYFYLYHYSQGKSQILTDQFQVILTARGMVVDTARVGDMKTVFKDLPPMLPLTEIYVCCKVVRKGGMTMRESSAVQLAKAKDKDKKASNDPTDLRRPFGLAMLNVGSAGIKRGKEVENMMPIYKHTKDENQYWSLFDLVQKKSRDVAEVPNSKGISVGLNMLTGPWEDHVAVSKELAGIPITPTLSIGEDEATGFQRNDIYITLKEADFAGASVNAEIVTEVRDANGTAVPNCLIPGTNYNPFPQTRLRSWIYPKTPNPIWEETFLLRLPVSSFVPGLHMFLTFRSIGSEKKDKAEGFAFAKVDLMNLQTGTVVKDGVQTIQLIKPPKGIDGKKDVQWYLRPQAPDAKTSSKSSSGTKEKDGGVAGEWVKIQTKVVSNQLTQNQYLHGLFNWRQNKVSLPEVLGKITFAGDEIIKFLKETFDAFFAILDDANGAAPHVFTALIDVIEMLVDEKKQRKNYRPILDNYINEHFKGIYAQEHLLTCLGQYFGEYEQKRELIKTLKSLEYILKFIIQSRILLMSHGAVVDSFGFKNQLLDFFGKINNLLRNTDKKFAGAQTTAIKKLSPLFDLLLKIFTPVELAGILVDFLGAIPYDENSKHMNMEKLSLIETLVNGELFCVQEARDMLLHRIVTPLQLHLHLKVDEETPLVISIMHSLMENLQTRASENPYTELLVPMLPTLVQLVENSAQGTKFGTNTKDEMIHYDVVMSLVGLYFFMGPHHFGNYIELLPDLTSQQYFLQSTFDVLLKFVNKSLVTFPDNWFVMHMCMFNTVLKVIVVLAHFMQQRLDHISEERGLWKSFFQLTLAYINSNILELESFAETKRKMILERYGDMRMDVIQILQLMWQLLEHHQAWFLEDLVPPFFQLVSLEQPILSDRGTDLYMTLLQREYQATGSFKTVENLTIEMLDNVFYSILDRARTNAKTADEQREYVMSWFESKLQPKYGYLVDASGAIDELLLTNMRGFVGDMTHLMQLLYDFRVIPEDPAWEDERTISTIRLMEYFRSTGRIDAYKRYVHALVQQHVSGNNFAEAAQTLLLHANLLSFNDTSSIEDAQGGFPRQSASSRKIALYRQAITYFDQGKMWEMCVRLLDELRAVMDKDLYDYVTLSELATQQGVFYKNIATIERFFCEYFRVGYYGRGFPITLRNKEFIFRGLELERLADFSQRIHAKFPDAVLMKSTDPPSDDILQSEGQQLQIFSVKPCSIVEKDGKPNPRIHKNMPANISRYHQVNEVNCFLYAKPIRKNKVKGESQVAEFADIWYLNFYHVTEDSFPTVHTRTEVIKKILVETKPVQNAVAMILDKNREIQTVTAKQEAAGSTLTLVLKGVIDAAVNGGTDLYKEAFLSDTYLQAHPQDIGLCEQLHQGLSAQIGLLDEGLKVHAKLCSNDMAGLQEQLEVRLKTMTEQVKISSVEIEALFARYQQFKTAGSGAATPSDSLSAAPSSDDLAAPNPEVAAKKIGALEAKGEIALNLIRAGYDDPSIISISGLPASQIRSLRTNGQIELPVSTKSGSSLTSKRVTGAQFPQAAAPSPLGMSSPGLKRGISSMNMNANSKGSN